MCKQSIQKEILRNLCKQNIQNEILRNLCRQKIQKKSFEICVRKILKEKFLKNCAKLTRKTFKRNSLKSVQAKHSKSNYLKLEGAELIICLSLICLYSQSIKNKISFKAVILIFSNPWLIGSRTNPLQSYTVKIKKVYLIQKLR